MSGIGMAFRTARPVVGFSAISGLPSDSCCLIGSPISDRWMTPRRSRSVRSGRAGQRNAKVVNAGHRNSGRSDSLNRERQMRSRRGLGPGTTNRFQEREQRPQHDLVARLHADAEAEDRKQDHLPRHLVHDLEQSAGEPELVKESEEERDEKSAAPRATDPARKYSAPPRTRCSRRSAAPRLDSANERGSTRRASA